MDLRVVSNNEMEDEEQRLRNFLLEQMKKKNTGTELSDKNPTISSGSDDSEDESLEEEDLSELFLRQKSNELEYQRLRETILKTKQKLTELEQNLERKTKIGVEINENVKSRFESYFIADFEHLNRMGEERIKWKSKLNQRTTKAKERIKHLKENSALLTLQPKSEPKVIPLSPIRTPPTIDFEAEIPKTEAHHRRSSSPSHIKVNDSMSKKHRHSSRRSSSKKEHKKSKKRSSKDKRLDKLADKLSIDHIVGNGKSNDEAEAELLRRMLERTRRKHRSKEHSDRHQRRRSKSPNEPKPSTSRIDDAEFVEDPIQSQLESPLYPSQSMPTTSINPLEAPHPIISIPSYNVPPPIYPYVFPHHVPMQANYSTYAFDHSRLSAPQNMQSHPNFVPQFGPPTTIPSHLQFGPPTTIPSNLPVSPSPMPSTVQEPADQDMRITDHDIVCLMLKSYPRLCPPNVTPDELADKLLETNSIDYVAKMLSQAIPDAVKEHCFSPQLKHFISGLGVNK